MIQSRGLCADSRLVTTHEDQPWSVFAARPAPLADLVQSDKQRRLASLPAVESGDRKADEDPADLGPAPLAPAAAD